MEILISYNLFDVQLLGRHGDYMPRNTLMTFPVICSCCRAQPRGSFHEQFFHRHSNSTEIYSALIQVMIEWSLWNFAHGATAVLSWNLQNCVALWYHTMELRQFQFSIGFEWLWKKLFVKWAPGYCTQHTLTPTCFAEKLGLHVYHFLFWSRLRFFDTFTIWCLGGKTKTMKTCSLDSNRIRDISCIMWHVKRLTDQTSSRVSQLRLVTLKATWHMYAFTRCSMWTAQDTKPNRFELLTYFNYATAWACLNSAIKLDWYCSFFSLFGYDFSPLIFIIILFSVLHVFICSYSTNMEWQTWLLLYTFESCIKN